jgi:ATP-dependent Clp protease adapter protein ClpS
MQMAPHATDRAHIIVFNDETTSEQFVIELLTTMLGASSDGAADVVARIQVQGRAACGPYPTPVAEAMLQVARDHIKAAGQTLVLGLEQIGEVFRDRGRCRICGIESSAEPHHFNGEIAVVCDACVLSVADRAAKTTHDRQFKYTCDALSWHFAGITKDQLATISRRFPGHMRADVQVALDRLFSTEPIRFFGVYERYRYETLTIAALSEEGQNATTIAPAQYQDVDIGEEEPARCLANGLWLCRAGELRYAVALSFHREHSREAGICVEIVVPVGEPGSAFVQSRFAELEAAVDASRSYRGKVLSLDTDGDYRGRSRGVTVHRLPVVNQDEVILPDATLKLLDRNVLAFVSSRDRLRALGQSTRKGLLLYGPPGTGKAHTIRYLASNLPGHTTLIITAEQVGLLAQYMNLARLLQPSIVVIEDVDLIARAREEMGGPCEESLLNRLLNEMDGLKEDADILFVLTTNRPEQLEAALAGRPGRIDQAIEIPLPDAIGREKLVHLYGSRLQLKADVVAEAVKRTEGVSAATAQAGIVRAGGQAIVVGDIDEALDDMLFSGGKLNVALLGGAKGANA